MEKKFLTAAELVELYGISPDRLQTLVDEGALRALADRGTWKYRRDEVEGLVNSGSFPEAPASGQILSFRNTEDSGVFSEFDENTMSDQATVISKGGKDMDAIGLSTDFSPGEETPAPPGTETPRSLQDDLSDLLGIEEEASFAEELMGNSPAQSKASSGTPSSSTQEGGLSDLFDDEELLGFTPDELAPSRVDLTPPVLPTPDETTGEPQFTSEDTFQLDHKPTESPAPAEAASDFALQTGDADSGLSLETADSGLSLETADSGLSLETADSGLSLETADSGLSLETADSGLSLETADSGLSLETADSGLSLEAGDSGLMLENVDSGLSLEVIDESAPRQPSAAGTQRLEQLADEDDFLQPFAEDDSSGTSRLAAEEAWSEESEFADSFAEGSDDDPTGVVVLDSDESADDTAAAILDELAAEDEEAAVLEISDDSDDEEFEELLEADDEAFSEEFVAAEDSMDGESYAAMPVKAVPREPSWGVGTGIAVILATLVIGINGLLVWEGLSTMWTGADPSSLGGTIISSLSGLLG